MKIEEIMERFSWLEFLKMLKKTDSNITMLSSHQIGTIYVSANLSNIFSAIKLEPPRIFKSIISKKYRKFVTS